MYPNSHLDQLVFEPTAGTRWKFADHIALGEARGVNRIVDLLALDPGPISIWVVALQDNRPTACSHTRAGPHPIP